MWTQPSFQLYLNSVSGVLRLGQNNKKDPRIAAIIDSISKLGHGDTIFKIPSADDDIVDILASFINGLSESRNQIISDSTHNISKTTSEESDTLNKGRRALVFEYTSDFVSIIDHNYVYRDLNPSYCRAHNKRPEEILGKTVAEVWGNEAFEGSIKEMIDTCLNGTYVSYLDWFHFGTLGKRFMEVSYFPHSDRVDGKPLVIVISKDVTERGLAYEELRQSEERFRIIFEFAPDAYYINDNDGKFLDANLAAEKITGYQRNELIGKNILNLNLLPVKSLPKAAYILAQNALGLPTGPDEFAITRQDGSQVFVEIRTYPIELKHENFVLSIARDVSKRKKQEANLRKRKAALEAMVEARTAELARTNDELKTEIIRRKQTDLVLRESEQKYRMITERSLDGILQIDHTMKLVYVNESVCRISGYERKELIGKTFHVFIVERDLSLASSIFEQLMLGEAVENELNIIHKKGHELPIQFTATPIYIKGKVSGLTLVMRDISEKQAAEEMLLSYKEKLEDAVLERTSELTATNEQLRREIMDRQKAEDELRETTAQLIQSEKLSTIGELSAGIAHEINQPLNTIKIICKSILRDIRQEGNLIIEELSDDLREINDQISKMTQVIDHMRVFARKTAGNTQTEIDINELIEHTLGLLETQMVLDNVTIKRNFDANLPLFIGDAIQIEQVIINILSNAKHAVENNDIANRKIELSTLTENKTKNIVIEIADNGVGIPDEFKGEVLKPFFTTKDPGTGTGLGLSVSNKIIQKHGGRIELESKIGKGTKFSIVLPNVRENQSLLD